MKTRQDFPCKKLFFGLLFLCFTCLSTIRAAEVDEFERFSKRLPSWLVRAYVNPESASDLLQVDPEKSAKAIQQSIDWIKIVLKPKFIPDNLESLIELLPSGMQTRDYEKYVGVSPRYDCTVTQFEKAGYYFLVTQEAGFISFFVVPSDTDPSGRVTTPDRLSKFLQEQAYELFNHAQASFYYRAIRLTDYGVETTTAGEAFYPDREFKGWKPTVIVPPKAFEDGAISFPGVPNYEVFGRKLKTIDPTIPSDQLEQVDSYWWGGVSAATDGRILFYNSTKTRGGGPWRNINIPDWFRIPKPGEIPPKTGSKINSAPLEKPRE